MSAPFELRGINHLALVCRDMARTVEFYEGVLGMPLVKTVELPAGMGQHFFFDCGGGDLLAFFWFPEAPAGVPGISAPAARPDQGELTSAIGSMNHVAFSVPRGQDRGVPASGCSRSASPAARWPTTTTASGASAGDLHPGVFVRSIYFQDPDGILLEMACATRPFTPDDVGHAPVASAG